MKLLLMFLFYFISIYLIYLIFVISRGSKADKYKRSSQITFFIKRYHLDFNKISYNKFINIIALTNSFIMAITVILVSNINNLILKLAVAFVILMALIAICYKLIGIYIERRNKNV